MSTVIDLTNDDDDFTEIRRQDVQLVELDDDPVFLAVVEYVDGLMRQSSLTKHKPKVKLEEVKAEPTSPVQGMEWEDEQSNVNPVEFAEVVMQEPPNPEPDYPQGEFKITRFFFFSFILNLKIPKLGIKFSFISFKKNHFIQKKIG